MDIQAIKDNNEFIKDLISAMFWIEQALKIKKDDTELQGIYLLISEHMKREA